MSGAAAIPLGGLFAGGAKLFRKGFKYLSKACSFTRGTRVETYLGLEPIEEIPDDTITQAKDEVTGELKWARVVNTFAEWHEEVIALEILGPTGKREEIVTTAEHPLFLADRGWTPASEIREGDKVVLKDDEFGEILKVEVRNEPQMAYNLDVEEVDTYLVGELGVWVHNTCKFRPNKLTKPYKRPSGATTKAQRESVQGKPCVECGKANGKMNADHKNPLVKEYYETGTVNKKRMRSLDSVQPQCPSCSNQQGGKLSNYSKQMKRSLDL